MTMTISDAGKIILLPLARIRTDGDTQPRCVLLDPGTVNDYYELMEDGHEFPPGVVFYDGEHYWLAEGFQRRAACELAGRSHMPCRVYPGGVREARLHAAGSNATHGLRRTAADMRKAVHMVLADPDGATWPVEKVAEHCRVPRGLVKALKASTPWQQPQGLFGVDELAEPPLPDYAQEDRVALEERLLRSCRKFLRFCEKAGEDPVVVAHRVLAEMQAKKPKPKEAPPEEKPQRLTLEGACN